jgi:hypothetical protein
LLKKAGLSMDDVLSELKRYATWSILGRSSRL